MDFKTPALPLSYQQPNFDVSEVEKNKDDYQWWIDNNRYISSRYNVTTTSGDSYIENLSPVEKGFLYASVYTGKQKNLAFSHLTKDTNGSDLQSLWVKNKKGKQLGDRLTGELIKQLAAKHISSKSLSKRAQSAKAKLWEDVMVKYKEEAQVAVHDYLAKMGINYVPPLANKYNSQQSAEQFLTYSHKDELELAATEIGTYVERINDYDTLLVEACRQDLFSANYMGVYTYSDNGRITQKKVPFYNLIYDISSDDPFVKDGKYCGIIERLTPQQIFKRFPNLNQEQREEIKELARGRGFYDGYNAYYNTGNTINHLSRRTTGMELSVVTTWWNAPRDLGKKINKDRYGTERIVNTAEGEKSSEYSVNDLHFSTVIANKFLANCGYENNVVHSMANKADPEMPIKILQLNTMMGDGVSMYGSIYDLLVKMDAYDFKITDIMARHIGTGYLINGSKLDVKPRELIQDIKTTSVHVAPGVSGEVGDKTDNQPMATPLNFELDRAVIEYSQLSAELERKIEQAVNLSQISLGQQDNVIGKGVQQNSVNLSNTGNLNLYNNLFKFNQICLQYAVNLAKIVYSEGGNAELAPLIIGDRGLKALQIIKKYSLEDVLIEISPRDNPTEDQKARVLSMMQAFAQNQLITPKDYIDIEDADTWQEMKNTLEYSEKKRLEEKAADQQFAAQQQQAQIEAQNSAMMQRTAIEQQGATQRNKDTNIAKIGVKSMDTETVNQNQ